MTVSNCWKQYFTDKRTNEGVVELSNDSFLNDRIPEGPVIICMLLFTEYIIGRPVLRC